MGADVLSVGPLALQLGPVGALDRIPGPLHAGLQGLPQPDLLQGAHTKVENYGDMDVRLGPANGSSSPRDPQML